MNYSSTHNEHEHHNFEPELPKLHLRITSQKSSSEDGIIKINRADLANLPGLFIGDVVQVSNLLELSYAIIKASRGDSVTKGHVSLPRSIIKKFNLNENSIIQIQAVLKVPEIAILEINLEHSEPSRTHLTKVLFPYFKNAKRVLCMDSHFEIFTSRDYVNFTVEKLIDKNGLIDFGIITESTNIKCGKYIGTISEGVMGVVDELDYSNFLAQNNFGEDLKDKNQFSFLKLVDQSKISHIERSYEDASLVYLQREFEKHSDTHESEITSLSSSNFVNQIPEVGLKENTNNFPFGMNLQNNPFVPPSNSQLYNSIQVQSQHSIVTPDNQNFEQNLSTFSPKKSSSHSKSFNKGNSLINSPIEKNINPFSPTKEFLEKNSPIKIQRDSNKSYTSSSRKSRSISPGGASINSKRSKKRSEKSSKSTNSKKSRKEKKPKKKSKFNKTNTNNSSSKNSSIKSPALNDGPIENTHILESSLVIESIITNPEKQFPEASFSRNSSFSPQKNNFKKEPEPLNSSRHITSQFDTYQPNYGIKVEKPAGPSPKIKKLHPKTKINNLSLLNPQNESQIENDLNRSHISKKSIGGIEFYDIDPVPKSKSYNNLENLNNSFKNRNSNFPKTSRSRKNRAPNFLASEARDQEIENLLKVKIVKFFLSSPNLDPEVEHQLMIK